MLEILKMYDFYCDYKCKNKFRSLKDDFPSKILLVITPPRSGSTWITDLIRCHPYIQFHYSYIIYKFFEFNIHSRRYPRDLSNGVSANEEIEVIQNNFERIPGFDISKKITNLELKITRKKVNEKFSIEKIHPEFFMFKTRKFMNYLSFLSRNEIEVKLIFLTRRPRDILKSFITYQARNLNWYANLQGNILMRYMKNTFDSIFLLARKNSGLVLNFDDFKDDSSQELLSVYKFLWPNQNVFDNETNKKICQYASLLTDRVVRIKENKGAFLWSEKDREVGIDCYIDFRDKYSSSIDYVDAIYNKLIMLKNMV